MGFCFVNNVPSWPRRWPTQGERVLVVRLRRPPRQRHAGHLLRRPRVLFVSIHQWPLYPGTGRHDEIGRGDGRGFTMNIPVPPGTTGDVYLRAFDELVAPLAEAFAADLGHRVRRASTPTATTRSPSSAWRPATTGRSPAACCRWCRRAAGW